MNTKKLVVFLLWVMVPMIGLGLLMHSIAGQAAAAGVDAVNSNPMAAILVALLTTGAMMLPLLAVVLTQVIFKEPVLKGLGVSFKLNRWWVIGWLLMPVIAFAVVGVSLLMPGAKWTPDSELIQMSLQAMPEGIGLWGFIAISIVSGLFAGLTLNALFAFGEEIAWRGFLMKEFKGKKFLTVALWTGIIWGFWHAPIILNGHNYPQHPVAGVFMMVVFCLLLTPILMYFRIKSRSVIVPAIMHGTFNGVVGLSLLLVTPANDLLYGASGLAGFIVLLLLNLCIYLYDRYISKENIMTLPL